MALNTCVHGAPTGIYCEGCAQATRLATHLASLPPAQGQAPASAPVDHTTALLTERGSRYGKFADHAAVTQALKKVVHLHMGARWGAMRDDQREALDMILHKVGRIANGDPSYVDNWDDIAGYARLVADALRGQER